MCFSNEYINFLGSIEAVGLPQNPAVLYALGSIAVASLVSFLCIAALGQKLFRIASVASQLLQLLPIIVILLRDSTLE